MGNRIAEEVWDLTGLINIAKGGTNQGGFRDTFGEAGVEFGDLF